MKASILIIGLASVSWLEGCAFSKSVRISSSPAGAQVFVWGEYRGETPLKTSLSCDTFSPDFLVIKPRGGREEVVKLSYEWSIRNLIASLPFFPGYFIVAKCPKSEYHFVFTQEADGESSGAGRSGGQRRADLADQVRAPS